MDLEYGPQYDDFRAEVISFIKENEKTKLTGPPRSESRVEWQQKLIDNGYFIIGKIFTQPFRNIDVFVTVNLI